MAFDDKLEELFIDLPEPPADVGNALGAVRVGKMIHVAGTLPLAGGRIQYPGRVGIEVRIDNARLAARAAGMLALALVRRELGGTLNRVRRVVRVDGYVACGADFGDQAKVVDGASELFVQVFGPFGKHVRTAVGVASLPRNACVEISAVFEVK
jgi:enamine deaminase RidA (YjgF/YER057c/UK114 family)